VKKYEYFLLDWDGNLVKTLDVWLEACRITFEKRGLRLTDEEISASFGAVVEYLSRWGVQDIEAAVDEMDKLAKRKLPDAALYPDALEVLEGLKAANKKLALITSSIHENIEHLLEKHHVGSFFNVIIASDDVQHHKPHPESLEKALAYFGSPSKELVLMIGDSDKDIGAAKNAGVDSMLFYPPEHSKFYSLDNLRQLGPTYIVNDFRDVLKAI
jgi:HAD superfamily hydrolase (TIGR01549 family)